MNEITFLVTRGAVGAGVPFGVAEDFSEAVKWMPRLGIDPLPIALSSLKLLDERLEFGFISLVEKGEGLEFTGRNGLSSVLVGSALADYTRLRMGTEGFITVKNVDNPLLVACFLAALRVGSRVIKWPGVRFNLRRDGTVTLDAVDLKTIVGAGPTNVVVLDSSLDCAKEWIGGITIDPVSMTRFGAKIIQDGVAVDRYAWDGLDSFFRRCLVPSSEQSRMSGAGAGLVDVD
ncbi:MAG: hypothetical protein CBB68_15395 [Rhodospirillaceae bacterium TMED8]|nr:hypothetical protein [Magnetovibrio sp.]OUT47807.1 MAG: hypothetical protein CBB68_15395 [Rhodospirillaceae bacterium TMED8]